jgi:hypothetical protein
MHLDEARKEIRHLIESRAFESSETHRRLLEYLATKSLSEETDHLKEYTIGIEAFGKPPSYDPQEDSIVRTQISRLRLKLLEYYQSEGKDDPIRVEIPKGGFKLEFHRRDVAATLTNGSAQPVGRTSHLKSNTAPTTLPWVLCGILTVMCIVLGYTVLSPHDGASTQWPLSRIINAKQRTTIVLADAGFSRLRSLSGRHITLEEYLSDDYPKLLMPPAITPRELSFIDSFTRWPVLSQAEAETLKTIVALSGPLESRVSVRSARDLRPRDLMDGNFMLLGTQDSNPWVSRFCKFLNFQVVEELGGGDGRHFVNESPKPGEPLSYTGISRTGSDGWAYATVALVPNERSNGSVMILQGLHREGTAAAGLFLADEQNRAELRHALVAAKANPETAWFEMLIRAESIAAIPGKIEIISVRIIHAT